MDLEVSSRSIHGAYLDMGDGHGMQMASIPRLNEIRSDVYLSQSVMFHGIHVKIQSRVQIIHSCRCPVVQAEQYLNA